MIPRIVSERTFKIAAFWSTLAAVGLLAIAGNEILFASRRFLGALALLAALAAASVPILLKPRAEPGFTVILYTREGCTLCEEARALLAEMETRYGFDVWEEDIDADAKLAHDYGDAVPIIEVDGHELARMPLDWARIESEFIRRVRARMRPRPFG
jgi:hypothetical protein